MVCKIYSTGIAAQCIHHANPARVGWSSTRRFDDDLHQLDNMVFRTIRLELVFVDHLIAQFNGKTSLALIQRNQRAIHHIRRQIVFIVTHRGLSDGAL